MTTTNLTETAHNGPEHVLLVTFEGERVKMRPECRAPETANCRLQPKIESQCQCESWTIERADSPMATPFHRVKTYGGADIIHWMEPGRECHVCDWINACSAEETSVPGQQFTIGEFPIEPQWEIDYMQWRRAEPESGDSDA